MAVTVDGDFLDAPNADPTFPEDGGDGGDGGDGSGGNGSGSEPIDTGTSVGAAAVDQTQDGSGTGNRNGLGGFPTGQDIVADQSQPSISAADQGQPGFAGLNGANPPAGVDAGVWSDTVAGSQAAAAQNQPAPSITAGYNGAPGFVDTGGLPGNRGNAGGGGGLPNPGGFDQPPGGQDMAAGPGWAIDDHGKFSSTNTPDYVRQNQGFDRGYIGPGTIVQSEPRAQGPSNPIQQGRYVADNVKYSTFGGDGLGSGGFGGNFPATPDSLVVGTNWADYGPQQMRGGLYGSFSPGGVPFGAGVNMKGGDGNAQSIWNGSLGMAPPGGGGVNGPPAFAGGAGPGYGQGVTGVMSPGGSFAPIGGLPGNRTGLPGQDTLLANAPAIAGGGGLPGNRTGSTLTDQGQVLRNPDGSLRGVASPNGYYDPRFQSETNILSNAQQGDPLALRDARTLAAAGDANARTIVDAIGALPDFARSQNAANWDQAHSAEIAGRIQNGEFRGNTAATANLVDQKVNVPANPVDNSHALMTDQMRTSLVDTLTKLGASNFQPTFDRYGNMTLGYTAANGSPQTLTNNGRAFGLTDYANALDRLKGMVGSQQSAATAGGSRAPSRSAGGSSRGGGGGGGGNAGANLANAVTGIGGNPAADQEANQRIRDFFPNGGVSRATASAVGYQPGTMVNGNPPY